MIKKFLTDIKHILMLGGLVLALISLILFAAIHSLPLITTLTVICIIYNFFVCGFVILYNKKSIVSNETTLSGYLLINLFILYMSHLVVANTLNRDLYSNVMYIENHLFYLVLYSIFVLAFIMLLIYKLIRNMDNKKTLK